MRRIIVRNMIFSYLGYSFSFLRMYYEHVISLFNEWTKTAEEIRGRIRAEYKLMGAYYSTPLPKESD